MITSSKKITKPLASSETSSSKSRKPLQAYKRASYTEKKSAQRLMSSLPITRLESVSFFLYSVNI